MKSIFSPDTEMAAQKHEYCKSTVTLFVRRFHRSIKKIQKYKNRHKILIIKII